jgi:hypothetical protein
MIAPNIGGRELQPRELTPLEIIRRRVREQRREAAVGRVLADQRVVSLLLARLARERRRDDDQVLLADRHRIGCGALRGLDLLRVSENSSGSASRSPGPRDDAIHLPRSKSATSTSRFLFSRSTSAGPSRR